MKTPLEFVLDVAEDGDGLSAHETKVLLDAFKALAEKD